MIIAGPLIAAAIATQAGGEGPPGFPPSVLSLEEQCTFLGTFAAAYVFNGQRGVTVEEADRSLIIGNGAREVPISINQLFGMMMVARRFHGLDGDPLEIGFGAYAFCIMEGEI